MSCMNLAGFFGPLGTKMSDHDVVVVGAGPAGISAAIPLVESGLNVLILDGGDVQTQEITAGSYVDIRSSNNSQWKLFLGERFEALVASGEGSPKLRVPSLQNVLKLFKQAYSIHEDGFVAIGALANGGLSNAWGAGVARFDSRDLAAYPFNSSDLDMSYQRVAARIGISGTESDDLASFFGRGLPLQPPPRLNEIMALILERYKSNPNPSTKLGLRLGQSRNAVLTEALDGRGRCELCGLCMYGCPEQSIYNTSYDLEQLSSAQNLTHLPNIFIDSVRITSSRPMIFGHHLSDRKSVSFTPRRVILACGAIGSAKLVRQALGLFNRPIRLLSLPAAAFALWIPELMGTSIAEQSFALAQLSFMVEGPGATNEYAFGNLFVTTGIPIAEFIHHSPFSRHTARRLFRLLQSSMIVGNCFFPGSLTDNHVWVEADGSVHIVGDFVPHLDQWVRHVRRRIAATFWRYGAILLPGSFKVALPGADVHYAGTIPLSKSPALGEAHSNGEIEALPGVFIADGAALPYLPAKAHTLTIMANADRTGRIVADQLASLAK